MKFLIQWQVILPCPLTVTYKAESSGSLIHLQNICRVSCRRWQLTTAINPGMLHFSAVYFYKQSAHIQCEEQERLTLKESGEWNVIICDFCILFRSFRFLLMECYVNHRLISNRIKHAGITWRTSVWPCCYVKFLSLCMIKRHFCLLTLNNTNMWTTGDD